MHAVPGRMMAISRLPYLRGDSSEQPDVVCGRRLLFLYQGDGCLSPGSLTSAGTIVNNQKWSAGKRLLFLYQIKFTSRAL